MKRSRQSPLQVFAVPIVLAALSVIGLVSALLGDEWRDALSWGALSVPILAIGWAYRARRS